MEIVEKALKAAINPDTLKRALVEFSQMEPVDRMNFTARAVTMIRLLDEDISAELEDRTWIAMAIEWRLEALAKLRDTPQYKCYSMGQTEDEADWIREDMIEQAATEPLIKVDEYSVRFDPDSFFNNLLLRENPAGNA